MPKPTAGRRTSTKKTASPYGRKMVSNDVSTRGARPNQLSPTKRETYQVATSVPARPANTVSPRTASANRSRDAQYMNPKGAVAIRKRNARAYSSSKRRRTV